MGIENVVEGHGFGIAITGMVVVFSGLVLVVLFLTALPQVLAWIQAGGLQRRPAAGSDGVAAGEHAAAAVAPAGRAVNGMDADLLTAITYVLQAERDRQLALDHQEITLRDDDEQQRVWTAIGRMRTIATRM
jgi:hypothetical protein